MKKVLLFVVLAALLTVSAVFAQDLGVQLIGGPEIEAQPINLDDLKLNVEAEIDGFGILLPRSFEFNNYLMVYKQGNQKSGNLHDSGNDADYALLYFDITNTTLTPKDYLTDCEVKVIYDDIYEYAGWAYQQNYDYKHWETYSNNIDAPYSHKQNILYGIDPSENYSINSMYQGHYIFGCSLPNPVVNSKKPLRMEITLGDNDLTYYIRK